MSRWVTSFRMYNAAPQVKQGFRTLFGTLFEDLGVEIDIIDHSWPAPIESLWQRADLCCAFMCGWPFIHAELAMKPIAVPVPSLARYQDTSQYCSEFLVRSDSQWARLEDSFGHRFGYMTENSQSGFNAPRAALAPFANQRGGALFSAVIGPLDTPARALAALQNNDVDVIALDSFYLDLLRAHNAEALDGVATLASTPWTPMPLLVAAPHAPDQMVERLALRLTTLQHEAKYASLLRSVLIRRFDLPDRAAYQQLDEFTGAAKQLGYSVIR